MSRIVKLVPTEQKGRARRLRNNASPAERKLWQQLGASQPDGGHHGDAPDFARQRFVESQGYTVLRFWNAQVLQDVDMVRQVILEAVAGIDRRALRDCPPPTPPVPGGEQS